jgi:hypothetical protein
LPTVGITSSWRTLSWALPKSPRGRPQAVATPQSTSIAAALKIRRSGSHTLPLGPRRSNRLARDGRPVALVAHTGENEDLRVAGPGRPGSRDASAFVEMDQLSQALSPGGLSSADANGKSGRRIARQRH